MALMDSPLPQPALALSDGSLADSFVTARRTPHYLRAALAGLIGLLLCLPLAVRREAPALVLAVGGALLLIGACRLVRQARDLRPVLQLDDEGLWARGLPSPLAWLALEDATQVQRLGRVWLNLTLLHGVDTSSGRWRVFRPTAPRKLGVDLSLLDAADRGRAFEAVHRRLGQARSAAGAGPSRSALQAEQAEQFARELRALAPATWALFAVVAANVLVWLATVLRGLDVFRPDSAALFRWGANSAWAVTQDHDYRRLLASTLLHSGASHLLSNLLGLWVAGRFVNRLYGNAQFLLIYVGSALAGSVVSLHFSAQRQISVGASGAVFGVLGAFLVAMLFYRNRLPDHMGRRLVVSQLLFVGYSLTAGFLAKQGIDNAAHVGGLLGGALMAWLLIEKAGESPSVRRRTQRGLIASAVMGVLLVLGVRNTPLPPVNHREVFAMREALVILQPQLVAVWRAWQQDSEAVRDGRLAPATYMQALESRHVPAFQAMEQALALQARARSGNEAALTDAQLMVGVTRKIMALHIQRYRSPQDAATSDGLLAARVSELRQISQRMAAREAARKAGTQTPLRGD